MPPALQLQGYSLHYLIFGWRPRLPINFYFPTVGRTKAPTKEASVKHLDESLASIWDRLRTSLWEAKTQLMTEACQQKWYYDWKIGAVNLKPGDLELVKADAFKQKRKIKDKWEEDSCEIVHQIATDIPSYKVMDQCGRSGILHWNWLLLITSEVGVPLYIGICHVWDRLYQPHPMQAHLYRRWNWDDATREYW